jgi:uncharacterized membrane protein
MGARTLSPAGAWLVAWLAFTGVAAAADGFQICNETGGNIEVAKALNTGATDGTNRIIISEGWYQVTAGQCVHLWVGELQYKYYLLYAQNKSIGREWKGDIPLCVSREAFTIRSDTCGPGHYRRMFFEVNTGDEPGWTHTFR